MVSIAGWKQSCRTGGMLNDWRHCDPACAQGWEELALVVESAIAGRSKEVALAALACLTGLLGAQGTACPGLVWRRSLRALGVGIEAATSPLCLVPLQVLLNTSHPCAGSPLHGVAPLCLVSLQGCLAPSQHCLALGGCPACSHIVRFLVARSPSVPVHAKGCMTAQAVDSRSLHGIRAVYGSDSMWTAGTAGAGQCHWAGVHVAGDPAGGAAHAGPVPLAGAPRQMPHVC